jgi:hypothetical protein
VPETTTVTFRRLTNGTEGETILDQLETATGLHGERVDAGRRYDLSDSRDLMIAMASIKGQLDTISASWPIHLEIDVAAQ